jgi:hypothetical protein
LAALQSNVPACDGYTRSHWPFWTWLMATHGEGVRAAMLVGPMRPSASH